MHVNSVSSVKFTFYKKVIRKLETKWLINMTFFGEKILHFRQTLTFIEERRDMRRKLFVDTIFSRIRSIMALIPQFIYRSVRIQEMCRVTAWSDMWCVVSWCGDVLMFQTVRGVERARHVWTLPEYQHFSSSSHIIFLAMDWWVVRVNRHKISSKFPVTGRGGGIFGK